MKRFWTEVTIAGGQILLDGKPVRTPGKLPLALPYPALADAVAAEWRAVEGEIDPRAMPMTGLANAALEPIAADRPRFAASLARYAENDLLCYRAEAPPVLVARQAAAWDPLLDWARTRYDVHFVVTVGVMPVTQPPATVARLSEAVAALDSFVLAGLSPVVSLSGSLVAALALLEGAATPEAVWTAAEIDETWQAEMWGEDWLAAETRRLRGLEFGEGVRFLGLLR